MRKVAALLALFHLALAEVASAQTTEEAMTRYKQTFQSPREMDCPRSTDTDIVVCARPDGERDPNRLPLPSEDAGRRLPGEPIGAVAASGVGNERCSTTGPNQQCGGGFPVFAIAGFLFRVAKKVADPESE